MIGMSTDRPAPVVRMRLTAAVAQQRIREAATVTANIIWSKHALERMEERDISDKDVLRILRGGFIEGAPKETDRSGEWKCNVTLKIRGGRTAGVVTIILVSGKLFVKTVEWEDLS